MIDIHPYQRAERQRGEEGGGGLPIVVFVQDRDPKVGLKVLLRDAPMGSTRYDLLRPEALRNIGEYVAYVESQTGLRVDTNSLPGKITPATRFLYMECFGDWVKNPSSDGSKQGLWEINHIFSVHRGFGVPLDERALEIIEDALAIREDKRG